MIDQHITIRIYIGRTKFQDCICRVYTHDAESVCVEIKIPLITIPTDPFTDCTEMIHQEIDANLRIYQIEYQYITDMTVIHVQQQNRMYTKPAPNA